MSPSPSPTPTPSPIQRPVPVSPRGSSGPPTGPYRRVAVVGAGLSGLTCARVLQAAGVAVTVFDKGRSPGGRLATRRTEAGGFDLGAQYFTVRDPRFRAEVAKWREAAVVVPWPGRIVAWDGPEAGVRATEPLERLVALPGMSTLSQHLAADLPVLSSHRVDRIRRSETETKRGLSLWGQRAAEGTTLPPKRPGPDDDGQNQAGVDLGTFDAVAVCLPADQAVELLAVTSPRLAERARAVPFEPCFAVGLTARGGSQAERALARLPFDGAFIGREGERASSCLSWIARETSKPGRASGERWMLHASSAWSRAQIDADRRREEVVAEMVKELSTLFDLGPLDDAETFVHRWGFARPARTLVGADDHSRTISAPETPPFDVESAIGLAGDWVAGGRVEGAFLSGLWLGERLCGGGEVVV
jgi:renalase